MAAAAAAAVATTGERPFDDEAHMREALVEADCAAARHEVPVGAVFIDVDDRTVVARGHNLTNNAMNGARHAELEAVDVLMASVGGAEALARLRRSRLYVTLEPCVMCASALAKVGVASVAFGAWNDKFGGAGSALALHDGWRSAPADAGALREAALRSPYAGRVAPVWPMAGGGVATSASASASTSGIEGEAREPGAWHRYPVVGGVLKGACIEVLKRFYEGGAEGAAAGEV